MSHPKFDPAKQRLRYIKGIQAMRRKFHLEDVEYRDLVERISRQHGPAVRSAGECTLAQLSAIATELRKKEQQPEQRAKAARGWAGRPKGDMAPQVAKIEALLADAGREWAYAHSVAKRICKVNRVEWCNTEQLGKLIAALQIDAHRRQRRRAES